MALNDILQPLGNDVRSATSDEDAFPSSSDALSGAPPDAAAYVIGLVDRYMEILDPSLDALATTAQWAQPAHLQALTRFVEYLAPASAGGAGMVVLTSLRWFPILPVEYVGTLGALVQQNYGAVKAILIDATVRDRDDGRLPLISRGHPWRPFSHFDLVPQMLALRASGEEVGREVADQLRQGRKGKRHTPVSDYLHDTLRPKFQVDIPDDEDYSDLFDRAEILMALLAIDSENQRSAERVDFDRPSMGRFTWRNRFGRPEDRIEARMHAELVSSGDSWKPLEAGLFGGSPDRATAAFESLLAQAGEARESRF